MPYKNPEDKRRWEREHRERRNAQRRMRQLGGKAGPIAPCPVPDPVSDQRRKGGWKEIIGVAIGFGVVLLAALGGVPLPASDPLTPSPSASD